MIKFKTPKKKRGKISYETGSNKSAKKFIIKKGLIE